MTARNLTRVLACAALGLLAAGCAGNLNHFVDQARCSLARSECTVAAAEYQVMPPDIISVNSVRVPEINGVRQQVRPDGRINLPLLGQIDVAGCTPNEIQNRIIDASKRFYKEPLDATVNVEGFLSQKVYVFGQVSRPGPQPWTGTNTLIDALAQSQPNDLAWPEKIRLVRGKSPTRGGPLTPEQIQQAAEEAADEKPPTHPMVRETEGRVLVVNMKTMVEKGDLSRNVLLRPDDVIFVPPTPLAKIGLAIQQLLLPIRPAAETVYEPARAATIAGGMP
jgi:polysaccharide export outer membrane protein